MKYFLLFFSLLFNLISYGQENKEYNVEERHLKRIKEILEKALTDTSQYNNVINRHRIIVKDKNTAIKIAEPILFDIYGKQSIKRQRPYDVNNIDNYWVITGTLRKRWKGGTFLIIIDSHDARVIKIIHGK